MNIKDSVIEKELASLGYGYGITISPFQIATAYSVFANNGVFKDFNLIKDNISTSRQIISPESASYVLNALQEVVQDGTARAASIKGFSVAGKTGTAHQIRGRSGYA